LTNNALRRSRRCVAVTLTIRSTEGGAGAAQTLTFDQPRVVVGRGAHADVRLPSRGISSAHCALRAEGGELAITDDGSTNGTLVNGALLVRGRRKVVRDGDRVTVPGFELTISITTAVADSAERTATVARKLLSEAIALAGDEGAPPSLELRSGRKSGQRWTFATTPSKLIVGRGDNCDIIIDDVDSSRHHAEFVRDDQGVLLRDLNSKNGVFVAGRRVTERRLRDGDEAQIGRVVLVFRDPADELLRAFDGGADESKPVEPVRASTIPPPAMMAAAASAASQPPPSGASNGGADASGDPSKSDLGAEKSVNPAADGASKSAVTAVKSAQISPKKKGSLDWVVALLALLILGVSVLALVMVLRPR
jgi:pSer/pThr/pTyr-binding forkhead associated (FHA) protein